MNDTETQFVLAATAPSEEIAAIKMAHLEAEGIEAKTSGALTSAFRAEAPADVQIYVPHAQAARAQAILQDVPADFGQETSEKRGEDQRGRTGFLSFREPSRMERIALIYMISIMAFWGVIFILVGFILKAAGGLS
jgi:hypothetical protein